MRDSGFQRWIPAEDLAAGYDVNGIRWGTNGLVFELVPDGFGVDRSGRKLRLIWEWGDVLAYHVTDEAYREDRWVPDPGEYWPFYVSKSSEYLDAFRKNSCLFPDNALHFSLVGTNIVVDILAKGSPSVEML